MAPLHYLGDLGPVLPRLGDPQAEHPVHPGPFAQSGTKRELGQVRGMLVGRSAAAGVGGVEGSGVHPGLYPARVRVCRFDYLGAVLECAGAADFMFRPKPAGKPFANCSRLMSGQQVPVHVGRYARLLPHPTLTASKTKILQSIQVSKTVTPNLKLGHLSLYPRLELGGGGWMAP